MLTRTELGITSAISQISGSLKPTSRMADYSESYDILDEIVAAEQERYAKV
jgi:hypothetical protein